MSTGAVLTAAKEWLTEQRWDAGEGPLSAMMYATDALGLGPTHTPDGATSIGEYANAVMLFAETIEVVPRRSRRDMNMIETNVDLWSITRTDYAMVRAAFDRAIGRVS